MLHMEAGQPLCLGCAKMNDLEFLPAGDTALTRRSTKYSGRIAIVLRFSRSRGRYQRQGVLVEPAALARAEEECAGDAAARAAARERTCAARKEYDAIFIEAMSARIRELYPRIPGKEARAIAAHTAQRGSGRVGRSAAGRDLQPAAIALAVQAAIRHLHTKYDALLARGADRAMAREAIRGEVEAIVSRWSDL